jgi:cytochrome P450 PksS
MVCVVTLEGPGTRRETNLMPPPRFTALGGPQLRANPYPLYARLRRESPVLQVVLPDGQKAWLITRYDDALSGFKDKRLSKDKLNAGEKQPWVPAFFEPLSRNMLDLDDPDHARLRGLVHKVFTPRLVDALRQTTETLTEELIYTAKARGRMDLIADVALPLPVEIISRMLGVPANERHKFHHWSGAVISSQSSKFGAFKAMPSVVLFLRYIRRLVRLRRENPQDDLTSALVQAKEAGDRLSEDEMVAMIFLLLIAGHETTVNLIGNGTLALLTHPEQMDKLRADPLLTSSAVEELLRFDGPVEMATERYALGPVEFSGVVIPAGALVYIVIASANRDERQFERAYELDITRINNRHLSFGQGIHFCLGAPLARLEATIAFTALLRHMPRLRMACRYEDIRWKPGLVLRGIKALPVEF